MADTPQQRLVEEKLRAEYFAKGGVVTRCERGVRGGLQKYFSEQASKGGKANARRWVGSSK